MIFWEAFEILTHSSPISQEDLFFPFFFLKGTINIPQKDTVFIPVSVFRRAWHVEQNKSSLVRPVNNDFIQLHGSVHSPNIWLVAVQKSHLELLLEISMCKKNKVITPKRKVTKLQALWLIPRSKSNFRLCLHGLAHTVWLYIFCIICPHSKSIIWKAGCTKIRECPESLIQHLSWTIKTAQYQWQRNEVSLAYEVLKGCWWNIPQGSSQKVYCLGTRRKELHMQWFSPIINLLLVAFDWLDTLKLGSPVKGCCHVSIDNIGEWQTTKFSLASTILNAFGKNSLNNSTKRRNVDECDDRLKKGHGLCRMPQPTARLSVSLQLLS